MGKSSKSQSSGGFSATLAHSPPGADAGSDSDADTPRRPSAGDQIAINCPADPPHPAGWYSAVVVDIEASSSGHVTMRVEWDGGDIETLIDPEWRMLGEEPDQKGNTSAKDQRLRPHLSHVVRRLVCTDVAESKVRARGGWVGGGGRRAGTGRRIRGRGTSRGLPWSAG